MRWKKKVKPPKRNGDYRITTKFLLFPKCLENEWRWLETASILQRCSRNLNVSDFTYNMLLWYDVEWSQSEGLMYTQPNRPHAEKAKESAIDHRVNRNQPRVRKRLYDLSQQVNLAKKWEKK